METRRMATRSWRLRSSANSEAYQAPEDRRECTAPSAEENGEGSGTGDEVRGRGGERTAQNGGGSFSVSQDSSDSQESSDHGKRRLARSAKSKTPAPRGRPRGINVPRRRAGVKRKLETDKEYLVDAILDKRVAIISGDVQYYVKWHGCPDSDNTWEPQKNFDANIKVEEFEEQLRNQEDARRRLLTAADAVDNNQPEVQGNHEYNGVPNAANQVIQHEGSEVAHEVQNNEFQISDNEILDNEDPAADDRVPGLEHRHHLTPHEIERRSDLLPVVFRGARAIVKRSANMFSFVFVRLCLLFGFTFAAFVLFMILIN